MATKIGDFYFETTANTDGARASIMGLAGAATQSASLIAGAMATAFAAVGIAAASAAALATKEIISMGVAFNVAGQQAQALFTALTGSADEARGLLAEFSQLSLDSPVFDVTSLQKTTSLLLTFQVAKADAFEMAQNINLAAIALGRGEAGAIALARAFGQIQGRGWLEGDEARQLSEVGVNAYAVIAEAIGKTTGEVIKMGRESQLLAEDVLPILNEFMENTFGPVAANMLNTFSVQVQGVKNAFQGIGSAIVEPFIGRSGGGAVVDVISMVRDELIGMIEVADDGSFKLVGALAPLTAVSEALATAFTEAGTAFVEWLRDASSNGGIESLANGLAAIIPLLIDGVGTGISAGIDFFTGMWDAIQPLLPAIGDLAGLLYNFATEALPEVVRGIVAFMDAAAPIAAVLIGISTGFLSIASPVILDLLTATADVLEILADNIETIVALWISWKTAIIIAEIATATYTTVTLSALSVALTGIIVKLGLALAVLGAFKSLSAGISGDIGFLNEDVPFYEKPFQLAGRAAFAVTGGDRGLTEQTDQFDVAREAAEEFNLSLIGSATTFEEARAQAMQYAAGLNYTATQASDFANVVALAWSEVDVAARAAAREQERIGGITLSRALSYSELLDAFTERLALLGQMRIEISPGEFEIVPIIEESTDLIKLLEGAAKSAESALKALFQADANATVDDFLRNLPGLASDLTKALGQGGILGDLEVSGVLDSAGAQARKVIQTLATDYGLSMAQIKTLFNEQGLAGVLGALNTVVIESGSEVADLIEQYGHLGVSVDVLTAASKKLNEQRTAGLEAQIDAVTIALDAAKEAADEAREALERYFMGTAGGVQGEIDKLTLDIPDIGSAIEKGLLTGGPQGEAMIRQALGEAGSALGSIFQEGLDRGLNPQQIIDMLGPVYGSIQQEIGGALNRISSDVEGNFDWTKGFTPGAASEIEGWLAGILDPAKISDLFAGINGADGMITGLETQLDELKAQLKIDGVFNDEQMQAAIDEVTISASPDLMVSDEAAAALEAAINAELNNADFAIGIDELHLTNAILDAAKAAEDKIEMEFNSSLVFSRETLTAMADVVGGNFAVLFSDKLKEIFAAGGGEGFASLMIPTSFPEPSSSTNSSNVVVNNDIVISGQQTPRATASEVVAASSAAAGAGGRFSGRAPVVGRNVPR